jgi:hypothetical protein
MRSNEVKPSSNSHDATEPECDMLEGAIGRLSSRGDDGSGFRTTPPGLDGDARWSISGDLLHWF